MTIITGKDFEKGFKKLHPDYQELYQKQRRIFEKDWTDSRLQIKKLKGFKNIFSFRITSKYRVYFHFKNIDIAEFIIIGHRKEQRKTLR